jgi:antitoxin YefM
MIFTTTYSALRQNLASVLQKVVDDRLPCIVSRRGHDDVVILPREDWEGMEETLYLLSNPENARQLEESIAQGKRGEIHLAPFETL